MTLVQGSECAGGRGNGSSKSISVPATCMPPLLPDHPVPTYQGLEASGQPDPPIA